MRSVLNPNDPSVLKLSRENSSRGRHGETVQSMRVEAPLVQST